MPSLRIMRAKIWVKLICLGVLCHANFLAAQTIPAEPPKELGLQECFELAVFRSETLGMKYEDLRIAEAQYWQAFSGLLPNVHAKATQTLRDSMNSSSGNSGSAASRDPFTSGIEISQPLFHGFKELYAAQAANSEKNARSFDLVRARQTLYLSVAEVFYQQIGYEKNLLILMETENALIERLKDLERRASIGRSRESEVLQAKTDLADSRATIEETKGLLGATKELLAFLTGVPAAKLNLIDKQPFPTSDTLEAYLQASQGRADLQAAREKEKSETKQLSAARADHLPQVDVSSSISTGSAPKVDHDWNILLTVDVPIFEGGLIEARVKEHKSLVRQAQLNFSEVSRTVEKETRTAYNDFVSSTQEYLKLKELVDVSGKNLEVQKRDYQRGIVNNLDVLDALQKYQAAQRRLIDVNRTARYNLIRLIIATGQEPLKKS